MAGFGDGNLGRGLAQGLEVAIGAGLGYVIGNWVDRRWGFAPWGLMIGVMLGSAAGIYLLVRDANRSDKN
jgi:F0F1-type ATP synthase assembly protein I